ncbi:MAG: DUF4007 family protein [Lachnospiraceae bacterium]|nr:DUF4007 family protein [Ruminococcus sp.]MCM1273783.1 DUF4007 family protein [Lachnospiraceae bacterium]
MSSVVRESGVFQGAAGNPMDVLGMGANMVKSLRYWLTASRLTSEPKSGKRNQELTELGKIIYENDPYMEEIGSIWLVHYMLASNEDEATSWYLFFNEFNKTEYDEDDFHSCIVKYIRMNDNASMPSDRVIDDDFSCIINTYVPRIRLNPAKVHPESNIDCPLGELGLVDIVDKKKGIFKKRVPKLEMLPNLILLASIIEANDGVKEIRISTLQNEKNQLGKLFNLDSVSLINALYRLEKTGFIKVIRTAGLDVIQITTDMSFCDCVKAYYKELNQ